jgi:SNF2 family DNA or RNA helicase
MNERLFDIHISDGDPLFNHKSLPVSLFYEYPDYLMAHQKKAIETVENGRMRHLFAHDTGVGKTLLGIELVKLFEAKTLVVCPLSIIETAWFEDLEKFAPEIKATNLWTVWKSSQKIYIDEIINDRQICIVNFETFKILCTDNFIKPEMFDMVLIDESSKIKNYKSQITKTLTKFCDDVDYVFLFSGTPAPNNKLEYFSQARIVDATIFGKSYYKFRNHYYHSTGYGGYTWVPQAGMEDMLLNKISQFSSVIRKEDVLDLPERTDNIIEVHMGAKEKKAYKEMCDGLYTGFEEGWITATNAGAKIMKLREICSGFLYDEHGDAHLIGRSKLRNLLELLDEIGDKQVLIWTQFQFEANQIRKAILENRKCVSGLVNGSVSQGQREEYIQNFKDGKLQYIVAHPKSLGHGVTLTNCTYAIYYSISYSHEEMYQSKDRIYRYGQKNKCSYYYLLTPGTIDKVIFRALSDKDKIAKVVFEYIKNKEWK